MVCTPTSTLALVVVVVASLSLSSASDEDEALASLLRSSPRAAAVAEAAAAAADAGSGSLAVWEPAQPDPRWYLLTEADALQESGLARRRERQGTSMAPGHHATPPSLSLSMDSNSDDDRRRPAEHKRGGPSLSIVNPLDVLRQRILLEIARRRIKQSEGQIQANRDLLRVIGKRGRFDALASNARFSSLDTTSDSDLLEAADAIDLLSERSRVPSGWQ